jgi:hypothetical protein
LERGLHRIAAEGFVSADEQKVLNFRVKGDDPMQAVSALYGNFLSVSRVGMDVQFEFIFLDLNMVAGLLEQVKNAEKPGTPELQGRTIAKLVMPGATILQLREHFENLFRALDEIVPKLPEAQNDRSSRIR